MAKPSLWVQVWTLTVCTGNIHHSFLTLGCSQPEGCSPAETAPTKVGKPASSLGCITAPPACSSVSHSPTSLFSLCSNLASLSNCIRFQGAEALPSENLVHPIRAFLRVWIFFIPLLPEPGPSTELCKDVTYLVTRAYADKNLSFPFFCS